MKNVAKKIIFFNLKKVKRILVFLTSNYIDGHLKDI